MVGRHCTTVFKENKFHEMNGKTQELLNKRKKKKKIKMIKKATIT